MTRKLTKKQQERLVWPRRYELFKKGKSIEEIATEEGVTLNSVKQSIEHAIREIIRNSYDDLRDRVGRLPYDAELDAHFKENLPHKALEYFKADREKWMRPFWLNTIEKERAHQRGHKGRVFDMLTGVIFNDILKELDYEPQTLPEDFARSLRPKIQAHLDWFIREHLLIDIEARRNPWVKRMQKKKNNRKG